MAAEADIVAQAQARGLDIALAERTDRFGVIAATEGPDKQGLLGLVVRQFAPDWLPESVEPTGGLRPSVYQILPGRHLYN